MKFCEEKIKRISGISALITLVASFILEIMRQQIPRLTERPTWAEFMLSCARNAFLLILAISFTAFLFLLLKKRLGITRAVFYTIYSDSLVAFLAGSVIMSIASLPDVTAVGMTPLQSIYYFFLGVFIMVLAIAVFVIAMIIFAVLRTVRSLKAKKHQDFN